jgi:hypothetical protein
MRSLRALRPESWPSALQGGDNAHGETHLRFIRLHGHDDRCASAAYRLPSPSNEHIVWTVLSYRKRRVRARETQQVEESGPGLPRPRGVLAARYTCSSARICAAVAARGLIAQVSRTWGSGWFRVLAGGAWDTSDGACHCGARVVLGAGEALAFCLQDLA